MSIMLRESGQEALVVEMPTRARGVRVERGARPSAPGCRPVQPSAPLRTSEPMVLALPSEEPLEQEQLSNRCMGAIIASFVVAVLLGAGVAVGQYLGTDSAASQQSSVVMSVR
ncbi:hypothetical protein [Propionimicrobium lymphophilum]|uniref:hypothetical protein n=1 Tax=Propionimicrobium lymphophilum TaxID=33012 RepID=UPI0023F32354|nr:hypothetical protein [Propionimicrobium lymphophilum]